MAGHGLKVGARLAMAMSSKPKRHTGKNICMKCEGRLAHLEITSRCMISCWHDVQVYHRIECHSWMLSKIYRYIGWPLHK